ncbi:hypothetical protein LAZ67_12001527 [Cordylochernes scorpioides]|uniref:Uncharacterized protein n=1 Tax=Cordylochernes scorpioides TaxID=51811 RepID=A0ABY6L3L6_9ARAC|nr:hypothetical protein LAZ67_12001527 [Cordylochernes scorpioides]
MAISEPKSAHLREVSLFAFNWKKSATEAHRMLEKFEDAELQALLAEDSTQMQEKLAKQLQVSQGAVSLRLNSLGMTQKLSRWVPHEHEKKSFLHRIVISGEKWIHFSNPTRQKSWGLPDQFPKQTPRPNRFGKNAMLCIWWDQTGVVYFELLKPGKMNDLHLKRSSAKFVPHLLTNEQKEHRKETCKNMVEMFNSDPHWIKIVITGDETWMYGYDPETKRQSSQWLQPGEPRFKKASLIKSKLKCLLITFINPIPAGRWSVPRTPHDSWSWRFPEGDADRRHPGAPSEKSPTVACSQQVWRLQVLVVASKTQRPQAGWPQNPVIQLKDAGHGLPEAQQSRHPRQEPDVRSRCSIRPVLPRRVESGFHPVQYMIALEQLLGKSSVYQLMKMSGQVLVELARVDLAERLVEEGLTIGTTLLKVFPYRQRPEKIVVGNLPLAIKDEDVVAALRPYCRVVSLTHEVVASGGYTWTTGNREALILLNEGMKLHQIPANLQTPSTSSSPAPPSSVANFPIRPYETPAPELPVPAPSISQLPSRAEPFLINTEPSAAPAKEKQTMYPSPVPAARRPQKQTMTVPSIQSTTPVTQILSPSLTLQERDQIENIFIQLGADSVLGPLYEEVDDGKVVAAKVQGTLLKYLKTSVTSLQWIQTLIERIQRTILNYLKTSETSVQWIQTLIKRIKRTILNYLKTSVTSQQWIQTLIKIIQRTILNYLKTSETSQQWIQTLIKIIQRTIFNYLKTSETSQQWIQTLIKIIQRTILNYLKTSETSQQWIQTLIKIIQRTIFNYLKTSETSQQWIQTLIKIIQRTIFNYLKTSETSQQWIQTLIKIIQRTILNYLKTSVTSLQWIQTLIERIQ